MKRKFVFWFILISILVGFIGFISLGNFVFIDCADIIAAGYNDQIGLGMALILFAFLGCFLPGLIFDFVKFLKSSGSPDDK